MNESVAAPAAPPVPASAVVPKKTTSSPMDLAKSTLRDARFFTELKSACPKILTPDRVVRAVLTAALGSVKLQECFTTSHGKATVAQAILKATQRGLEIDGRQGHLVPFFNKKKNAMEAQFIPGYQGLIDLAYRHPSVGCIWSEVVYDTDEFHYELGLDRTLKHIRNDDIPGNEIVAVYAVCKMKNSDDKTFVVLKRREIDKIKAFSRGASDPGSIWNQDPESMWKKSAIRQLVKYIPQSAELQEAVKDENELLEKKESSGPSASSAAASLFSGASEPPPTITVPPTTPPGDDNIPFDPPSPPPVVTEPASAPRPRRRSTATLVEEPIKTPQQQLADIVIELGGNFDSFVNRCIEDGHLPDSSTAGGFDELPTDICERLVANKSVIVKLLQ